MKGDSLKIRLVRLIKRRRINDTLRRQYRRLIQRTIGGRFTQIATQGHNIRQIWTIGKRGTKPTKRNSKTRITELLKGHLFFISFFVRDKCLSLFLFFFLSWFCPPLTFSATYFFSAAHFFLCRAYEPALGRIWQLLRPVKVINCVRQNLMLRYCGK